MSEPIDKKALKREYKESTPVAGIFQIKNHENGKIFLASSLNIHGPLNAHEFMLSSGTHRNRDLQKDYKSYGAAAFSFDVLATIQTKDDPGFNRVRELEVLEALWLEELNPVTPNGYNPNLKIRQA